MLRDLIAVILGIVIGIGGCQIRDHYRFKQSEMQIKESIKTAVPEPPPQNFWPPKE